jgi:hypothetical protein
METDKQRLKRKMDAYMAEEFSVLEREVGVDEVGVRWPDPVVQNTDDL